MGEFGGRNAGKEAAWTAIRGLVVITLLTALAACSTGVSSGANQSPSGNVSTPSSTPTPTDPSVIDQTADTLTTTLFPISQDVTLEASPSERLKVSPLKFVMGTSNAFAQPNAPIVTATVTFTSVSDDFAAYPILVVEPASWKVDNDCGTLVTGTRDQAVSAFQETMSTFTGPRLSKGQSVTGDFSFKLNGPGPWSLVMRDVSHAGGTDNVCELAGWSIPVGGATR
jgi:hypothetical protein